MNKTIKPMSVWTFPNGEKAFVICEAEHSEEKEMLVIFKCVEAEAAEIAYACPVEEFVDGNIIFADFITTFELKDSGVKPLTLWNHFKGARSMVITCAINIMTGEKLVVYRCLDNAKAGTNHPDGVYARPYAMFMSKTDKVKYPDAKQEYRFELAPDDAYNQKK